MQRAHCTRTNELKDQELRYLPPALRDKQQTQAPQPPPSFSSSFRRPRAGTLPSNVRLTSRDNDDQPVLLQHQHQHQPPQPQPRPVLKHSQSVAPSVPSGRLRSESLTLPNLVNPFAASVFSTNWSRNPTGGFSPVEESSDIADQDEIDSATLNYLGLAERPVPATLSELRSQQAALLVPQRNRSKTISGGPFMGRSGGLGPLPTRQEEEEEEYGVADYESIYGSSAPMVAKGFKQSVHLAAPTSRPRATSVGDLERLRRPDQYAGESEYLTSLNTFGIGKTQARPSPSVRFPPNGELARTISQPKTDSPAQVQTPSRSLWIGNLDSTMTSEALIHVFAPYGAIESLRLLPEKVCPRFLHMDLPI